MVKPFLSVVIPAYNEAGRLPLTLIDIDKHLSEQEYSYEILVINDGSTDNTSQIVEKFMPLIKNLKILDNKENHGKGAAIKQGMLIAKGSWRLFMDADNSTSVSEFNNMLPYFKEGYDIVIGARLMPAQLFYKRALGRFGNWAIRLILRLKIKDTQCGFKCFSEEAADRIFSLIKLPRWGFDFESLVLAKLMGYRIKEMPVTWVNSHDSHVKPSAYFQTLLEVLKIRWWLYRDVYKLRMKG